MHKFLSLHYTLTLTLSVAIYLFIEQQLTSISGIICLYFLIVSILLSKLCVIWQANQHHLLTAIKSLIIVFFSCFLLSLLALSLKLTWFFAIESYLVILFSTLELWLLYSHTLETIKREKITAQQHHSENLLQSAEISLLQKTLDTSQEELESKVQERTLELNIALQELEERNRELAAKTTIDELTGLYNRRYYDQKVLAEYRRSRRNLSPLSLIILDIDHFKKVNDTYGHLAGDECLKALAQVIKGSLHRSTDIACRFGGEEFCLILPETPSAGAELFANSLREKVANLAVNFQSQTINFTISCGVSTYKQQANSDPNSIFSAADKALYQAKQQGRNQVIVAEANLLSIED